MKNQWMKTISIVLAALLLLAVLPMSAMAEKESNAETTGSTATVSNASKEIATSSDAEVTDDEDDELLDGEIADDLPPVEEEEAELTDDIEPEETEAAAETEPEAVPETEPAAIPAELPEKAAEADITGTWTIDGVTTYRFEENGIGELILPEHEFPFGYTAEDDELTLEFEDTGINTAVFTFTVEDDTLILKKEEAAGTSEFLLEKTAD